jgi:hypothetical protein
VPEKMIVSAKPEAVFSVCPLVSSRPFSMTRKDYLENAILEDLPSVVLNRDQLHFVESIFENVPLSDEDAGRQLKPTLDHIANAAGMPSAL